MKAAIHVSGGCHHHHVGSWGVLKWLWLVGLVMSIEVDNSRKGIYTSWDSLGFW